VHPPRSARLSTQQVARAGQFLVAAELSLRGARGVGLTTEGRRTEIRATSSDGRALAIRVKTRRAGTWQPKLSEAEPQPDDDQSHRFWIFVDLSERSSRPTYYVVPEPWIQSDIRATHREYLDRHGGQRAETPDSQHHAVDEGRIEEWEGRWESLGL
jgi:hypothetical protein